MLRSFFAKEEGQGLVEYALILVLIAVVVIAALTAAWSRISEALFEHPGWNYQYWQLICYETVLITPGRYSQA
jgi:pilus assembly protein Flp/PilA